MELLQYTVLDFILFFGAYMGGVILHELCHWIAGKVLAQNVSMSLFGLRVEYDVPTENVARIRWISLSPLLLAILIVTSTFALGIVDNLFIWLVVIGLVINTSSSDLSIRKALGETILTDAIFNSHPKHGHSKTGNFNLWPRAVHTLRRKCISSRWHFTYGCRRSYLLLRRRSSVKKFCNK